MNNLFTPYTTKSTVTERVIFVLLLALAVFLRLYRLPEAPPGIHDDEIINARIADSLLAGAPISVFYEAGEGREGLYFLLLAASRALTARVPYWYRLPSIGCSLLTILLVYRLSRRWFGPWTALAAAGGLTAIYWPVYLGREALRSGMVPLLGTGMALALWRGLERPARDRRAWWWFALAGILLGLSMYTYPAARVVPLFIVLFVAYLALFHRARLRVHWRGLVLLLVIGALITIPLVTHVSAHEEQQKRITDLSGPLQALRAGDPRPVFSSTVATLGMFVWRGDPQPHYNLPGRPVFKPLSGLLFLGGVLIALLNLRHPASAYCLLWTVTLLAPGMVTQPAPHFSRAAGVFVTTFIFPGLAARWAAERLGQKGRVGLAVALGLLLSVNVGLTFRDYFYRWPEVSDVRNFRHAGLAEAARYLDRADETTPLAACSPFLNEQHFFWRSDRQALPYLLNRRDLDVGWYNCREAQLFPRGGQAGRYLFGGAWDFAPFVPPELVEQAQPVAAFDKDQNRLVRLEAADELEDWLAQFTPPSPNEPPPTFGGAMTFLGYQVEPAAPVPGGTLTVLTAWRVQATPPRSGGGPYGTLPGNLAIFLHLLDGSGAPIAQGDALTALSDTFRPGDVFVQQHVVALAQDVPAGEYSLATGLYVREGERLPLDSGAGDTLILGTVEVHDAGD